MHLRIEPSHNLDKSFRKRFWDFCRAREKNQKEAIEKVDSRYSQVFQISFVRVGLKDVEKQKKSLTYSPSPSLSVLFKGFESHDNGILCLNTSPAQLNISQTWISLYHSFILVTIYLDYSLLSISLGPLPYGLFHDLGSIPMLTLDKSILP